ncbi:MAG: hypothetical protein JSW25_00815 [Thermoplasmata archaeon]|nr:MAG: hypothetical protein JSW25_00815 [Thermoplasmata archaeon]
MGRVLTYQLEEEPRKALMGLRLRGIDHHVVFEGTESEGEFLKRFPETSMELKGLYSLDDGMLSLVLTDVPDEVHHSEVEDMFEDLVGTERF